MYWAEEFPERRFFFLGPVWCRWPGCKAYLPPAEEARAPFSIATEQDPLRPYTYVGPWQTDSMGAWGLHC